jgi:hypothetical protein
MDLEGVHSPVSGVSGAVGSAWGQRGDKTRKAATFLVSYSTQRHAVSAVSCLNVFGRKQHFNHNNDMTTLSFCLADQTDHDHCLFACLQYDSDKLRL